MNLLFVGFIASSPNDYKKNDKIIYTYFKDKYDRRSKSRV